jgi:hypothetical protein
MIYQLKMIQICTAVALVLVMTLSPVAQAHEQCDDHGDRILIRRTIPDPYAVKRTPLTSDRLSTTSTRLIDARRGFRPYSSVYGEPASYHHYGAYDDHFGISRPENRPWSYSQRTPRSYIQEFRNDHNDEQADRDASSAAPAINIIVTERVREDKPKPDMKIRIHNDRSAIPTTTGAVLITADGTVIQVGD